MSVTPSDRNVTFKRVIDENAYDSPYDSEDDVPLEVLHRKWMQPCDPLSENQSKNADLIDGGCATEASSSGCLFFRPRRTCGVPCVVHEADEPVCQYTACSEVVQLIPKLRVLIQNLCICTFYKVSDLANLHCAGAMCRSRSG